MKFLGSNTIAQLKTIFSRIFIKFPIINYPNKALSLDENFNPVWVDFIGTNGNNSGKKLALRKDDQGNGYVETDSTLFSYKGVITGTLDDLKDKTKTEGDVWTLRSKNSSDEGIEYVCVKKEENLVWEYLGEKFVQQDVYWEKPEGEGDGWKGKLLQNSPQLATVATSGSYNDLSDKPEIPSITITKPTNNNIDGSIKVDNTTINIKSADTVSDGDDILVSKAYVDAKDSALNNAIPKKYVTEIQVNRDETGQSGVVALTIPQIYIDTTLYSPEDTGKVTLPKYPDVPIKQITVDGNTVNPTDSGVVALTTPNIPIKTVKVDGTALNADADGAVNIKSSQYFANSLEYASNATLDISNFITESNTDHYYEKTVLIYNKSNNDITLGLPTSTSVAIIPMTSFPLTVGGNKYAEIVVTYYPKETGKSILTINGGVQV